MRDALVVFASVTSATRVKTYLMQKYSVRASVVQTPKELALLGCGYSVKTDAANVGLISDIIKRMGATSKGAFHADDYSRIM